jgi:hypothetical protein
MFPNSKVYLYVLYEYLVGIPQTLTLLFYPFIFLILTDDESAMQNLAARFGQNAL